MTIDPDVAKTGEPYVYTAGNPVNLRDQAGDSSVQTYFGPPIRIPVCRGVPYVCPPFVFGVLGRDFTSFEIAGAVPLQVFVTDEQPFPDTTFWVCASSCQYATLVFQETADFTFTGSNRTAMVGGGLEPANYVTITAEVDPLPFALFSDEDIPDPDFVVSLGSTNGRPVVLSADT